MVSHRIKNNNSKQTLLKNMRRIFINLYAKKFNFY